MLFPADGRLSTLTGHSPDEAADIQRCSTNDFGGATSNE
jgi:hypothetical protein